MRINNKYIKIILDIFILTVIFISIFFFVLSFKYPKKLYLIFSIPFICFIVCIIHELGHVFGCIFTKSQIKEVKIVFFKVSKEEISFLNKVILGGSVCFSASSSRKSKIIYMFGPIFSVILLIGSIIIYLITFNKLLIAWIIISILSVIFMLLPIKGSDIYNILKKERGVFNG